MALVVLLRWLFVIAVIGAVLSYNGVFDKFKKRRTEPIQQPPKVDLSDKTAKKKKPRNKPTERVASGTDSASANDKKMSNHVVSAAATSSQNKGPTRILTHDDDGGMGDKEFAQQFASRKEGINFATKKQNGTKSKIRTVKQRTADSDSPHLSAENSSTGQDGDDESTPAGSPAINAVSDTTPDTTGVSDMLEPAKDGPKILRLTGWEEARPKKQKPAPKAPEPVETKKQRQQRRKREEEKARIAESARDHQAKGQQQMRIARMAEGTSNQTRANAFQATNNAWTAKDGQSTVKQPPPPTSSVAPLDTFEPKPVTETDGSGAVVARPISELQDDQNSAASVPMLKKEQGSQKTSAFAASERERTGKTANSLHRTESWADQVMDEEEQMKWATNDPTAWEPVTTKKDKKKARKGDEETNGTSTAAKQVNGHSLKNVTNGVSSRAPAANKYKSLETEPVSNDLQDDDWEA